MRLSPIYVKFMAEMVGLAMTKSTIAPMGHTEQAMMLAIALHQATCPEDSVEIMILLQNYGDLIHDFWDGYVQAVKRHNSAGYGLAIMDVNEMMEKFRNGKE